MRKIVIFALIAVMASGCSIYRKYQRPEELTADVDSLYRAELIADPEDTTSFGSMPWEELFTDPCLKELFSELAGEEEAHVWTIRSVLEQL